MEGYIGTIMLTGIPTYRTPQYWLPCDGQLLQIQSDQYLYSIIGNTFGGDGRTTFALPDLRDKAPAPGLTYIICRQGSYPPPPEG